MLSSAAAAGGSGVAGAAESDAGTTGTADSASGKGKSPNVVFILSDQHNAKAMSCLGHPDVKTPHLDSLAADGVRFDACTTANPICTPSRVSLLSGQYCHNHGYYGLNGPTPQGLPSLPGHFRGAGYRTAAFGKIHCPGTWIIDDTDVFHDCTGTSVGGRSKEYAAYLAERGLTELEDHGGMREFGTRGNQTVDARPSKVSYRDGQEGWIATKSIEFMQECTSADTPFFLHVSFPKPHQCYTPAQEFWDLYDESSLTLPPNIDYPMDLKAPHLKAMAEHFRSGEWTLFEPRTFEAGRLRKLHGYLGCVSHTDHAVGEIVDWLDASGLADNTIVVYSSDHGDYACEQDVMEKAPGTCADAITRVPLIWRWPGAIRSGEVIGEVVETVDIANTLCALTGLPLMETADGQDLSAVLCDGAEAPTDRLGVTEFAWSKSVRKGPWRLVTYPREMFEDDYPDGFGELYNLDDDPWEMHNRYFDSGHAGIVRELERDLLEWLITTERPATIHGSKLSEQESPQNDVYYGHRLNKDMKMHYDRIKGAVKGGHFKNYQ
jgi:arylsulfatase